MTHPPFHSLTTEQREAISNGVGPSWAPLLIRQFLTSLSSLFFDSASWQHHDYGYYIGHSRADRKRCDDLFLAAMLMDSRQLDGWRWIVAICLSHQFYWLVRWFGWSSFNYDGHPDHATIPPEPMEIIRHVLRR